MEVLMVVIASILAINVAYAVWLAVLEFVRARRTRRELGALEDMWRVPTLPRRSRTRPSRALAGALAVVVLGGVAMATPAEERVVSTITGVIEQIRGEAPDDVAAIGRGATSSPDAISSPEPSRPADRSPGDDEGRPHHGNGGGAGAATGHGPVGQPSTTSEPETPNAEASPTSDVAPSTTPSPEPTPTPVPTFASSAEATSDTEVLVTWERVPSATIYTVYRSDGGGVPVLVEEVVAGNLSVLAGGLAAGTSYDFTITALSPEDVLGISMTTGTTHTSVELDS